MPLSYMFCVVPAGTTLDLSGWRGDAAPLRRIDAEDVAAVVGSVDEDRFRPDLLAELASDVTALAPYARAHQEVVQLVFEQTVAVVPLSFGSVHRTDEDVRRSLAAERTRLATLLRELRGMQEWGLRVARRRRKVEVASGAPGAGAAYLKARRSELRRETEPEVMAVASALETKLARASVAARVFERDQGDLVLRAAYLVPVSRADEVKDLVLSDGAELERIGLGAELSGPWPAYSFAGAAR